jgi:hypothetical protein
MAESPKERLEALAGIVFALLPCPVCMEGQISASDPKKDAEALKLASDDWEKGNYPGLSKDDVTETMKSLLAEARLGCRECASDAHDDYDLKTMYMSTEDLDKAATLIYNRVDRRSTKEIYDYIAELKLALPNDNRVRLLELCIDGVLFEYRNAYQDEVAARRAAPIWHTRERKEERQELRTAKGRIEKLQQELEELRLPESKVRQEWERYQSDYRATRAAQDRLKTLEKKSELLSRAFICVVIALFTAICVDVWALIKPGEIYREAGKVIIGVCGLVTLIGPFMLFAVFRESRAARVDLDRYGPGLAHQAGIATKTSEPAPR